MTINVCSPTWDIADSYGRIAHELRNHLNSKGVHVNMLGEDAPDDVIFPALGGIFLAYPTDYKRYPNMAYLGDKIAVTMFESMILPEGWVDELNSCKAVIVPSHWCADVFRENGVSTPVHVVPLGISDTYKFVERPETVDTHKFLAIGLHNMRKGWDVALKAFDLAFWDRPEYTLTVKSRKGVPETNLSHPNITLIYEDYDDDQMQELYASHDYFLFPTRGEGFGLPPREFAVTGGIAFATNWSGTADDIDDWAIPIPVNKFIPAWDDLAYRHLHNCGTWAEPDVAALAFRMRYAVDNRRKLLDEARSASQFCTSHYSWKTFSERVYEIWRNA
jgi:glycosyltransferase involved in cell wall biosynthesis